MNNKRNLVFETLNAFFVKRMNSIFLKQIEQYSNDFINQNWHVLFQDDLIKKELEYDENPLIYF